MRGQQAQGKTQELVPRWGAAVRRPYEEISPGKAGVAATVMWRGLKLSTSRLPHSKGIDKPFR
jgi:hypothetical protein